MQWYVNGGVIYILSSRKSAIFGSCVLSSCTLCTCRYATCGWEHQGVNMFCPRWVRSLGTKHVHSPIASNLGFSILPKGTPLLSEHHTHLQMQLSLCSLFALSLAFTSLHCSISLISLLNVSFWTNQIMKSSASCLSLTLVSFSLGLRPLICLACRLRQAIPLTALFLSENFLRRSLPLVLSMCCHRRLPP